MSNKKEKNITNQSKSDNKKKISKLLNEDRNWHNVHDTLPNPDQIVFIRFTNPHYIYYETDVEIYYAEDLKLAKCTRDYDDPDNIEKCSWSIIPPYPKYDYSPLSKYDKINEGSVVTHWAEANDENIKDWNNRFNISDDYITLKFDIDDDHSELMYKALMFAMGYIGNAYVNNKSDELLAYHIVLQDLLNSMDKNIMIENGVEISKNTNYNPVEEDGFNDKVASELQEVINTINKEE